MSPQLPTCARCRVRVQVGQDVTFSIDGRVEHLQCPEVICPPCSRVIEPGQRIRRDGEQILHGDCWMRRFPSAPYERPLTDHDFTRMKRYSDRAVGAGAKALDRAREVLALKRELAARAAAYSKRAAVRAQVLREARTGVSASRIPPSAASR